MNQKVCFSKKNAYIVFVMFSLFLIVLLSKLLLEHNQANNSRADESTKNRVTPIPTAAPPSLIQQKNGYKIQVSLGNDGGIQVFNPVKQSDGTYKNIDIKPNPKLRYSIYMKRDNEWFHIDTFYADEETLLIKPFHYWLPPYNVISSEDVKNPNNIFYLFPLN